MKVNFRHFILIFALLSMALFGIAHANSPDHDFSECSVCLYHPNTDFNVSDADIIIADSIPHIERYHQRVSIPPTNTPVSPFFGRAPPVSS